MIRIASRRISWRAGLTLFFLLSLFCAPVAGANPAMAMEPAQGPAPTGPAVVQMTATTMQKNLPAEAVPEINLRVSGGSYPGCLDELEKPVIDYKTDYMDLTGITLIATCGWQAGETVKVTLMDPQGKYFTSEAKAVPSKNRADINQLIVTFQPGVDAPEGKYRFTLQGTLTKEGGTLKTAVFFHKPAGPTLYAAAKDRFQPAFQAMGGKLRLRLDGFRPNEPVKLLAYQFEKSVAKFSGWQDLKADGNGRLIVETNFGDLPPETEMNFSAYGLETHSVQMERFSPDGVRVSRQFDMDLFCPGAQAPRLAAVSAANAAPGASQVTIHQQPGFGSRVVARAPANVQLRVFDQPKCIDRAYWYKVSLSEPILFGWAAESFLGKYLLEPAN
jgi:hypothetical protein